MSENHSLASECGRTLAIAFGHSHLTALQFAYPHWKAAGGQLDVAFIQLLDERFRFEGTIQAANQHIVQTLSAEIDALAAAHEAEHTILFACFSANEHHPYSMVKGDRPFDFVLPGAEDLPLVAGAELLPYTAVERIMTQSLETPWNALTAIADAVTDRITCLASPPPIPDNAFLAGSNNAFRDQIGRFGLSDPSLRYKIWSLQVKLTEAVCARIGLGFLYPPDIAVDDRGFMREEGWHPDGVHGTSWYGLQQLTQISNAAQVEIERRTF